MKPFIINNLLSNEDVESLNKLFEDPKSEYVETSEGHTKLGRKSVIIPHGDISSSVHGLADIYGWEGLSLRGLNLVEYSSEFGQPNLPPHFDGDHTDVIVNYQLKSNTTWGVGVGEQVFSLEDNTAIVFNPNENIHWRPIKKFEPGEYVRMGFFRFWNESNPSDYSHLNLTQKDPVFDKIRNIRNSL